MISGGSTSEDIDILWLSVLAYITVAMECCASSCGCAETSRKAMAKASQHVANASCFFRSVCNSKEEKKYALSENDSSKFSTSGIFPSGGRWDQQSQKIMFSFLEQSTSCLAVVDPSNPASSSSDFGNRY